MDLKRIIITVCLILIDLICFVGGTILLLYNFLRLNISDFWPTTQYGVSDFFYTPSARLQMILGIVFIILGFIIRDWTKKYRK